MKTKIRTVLLSVLAVLVLVLGAAVGFLTWQIVRVQRYEEQMSLGEKYLADLDYENAEICFKEAIHIDEKRTASYLQLSIVYVKQGRYSEAKEMLQEVISHADPDGEEDMSWVEKQIETVEKEEQNRNPGGEVPTDIPNIPEPPKTEPESVNAKELFTTYLQQTLIPEMGLAELGPVEGWMENAEDSWYNSEGMLSALIKDLDQDGAEEMLVLSIGDAKVTDGYNREQNLLADVYEVTDGNVRLACSSIMKEYNEHEDGKATTFANMQTDNIRLYVNLVVAEGKPYLLFERYELANAFADGSTQDYWLLSYSDEQLKMEASFTQPGYGSAGFEYMGYYFRNGQLQETDLLYAEWSEDSGRYASFEDAVREFFQEKAVKVSYTKHGEPLMIGNDQVQKILEYRTEVTEWNYPAAKFRLQAADYTGLRELAGLPAAPTPKGLEAAAAKQGILAYYNNLQPDDGTYVIIDSEFEEKTDMYTAIVRYQVSDQEAMEIMERGGTVSANTLVSMVTVDKTTGEACDDIGNSWKIAG